MDVFLFQTDNDGDIDDSTGDLALTSGLDVAAYLALFGGNVDDDGSQDTPYQYWGNIDETSETRKYRSKTQNLLSTVPPIPANLGRIQDAASGDLSFFITEKIASSVDVIASMPNLNRVSLSVTIRAEGFEQEFNFVENWRASTNGN